MIAYIGPGPGLALQAPLLVMALAVIVAALSLLSFPFRYFRRRLKQGRLHPKARRVIVLGLDGLEPTRVERMLDEGRLPNLQALRKEGGYQRLGTTLPPLSPVAWSSFSTGVNPGKHGIFGFVERDRAYNLRLTSASVETRRTQLGPLRLPWTVERPLFHRKSTSFWKLLGDAGVLTHVLRVPITWPPEKFDGFLLSAMGAPDLMGTQGTYTLFSTTPRPTPHGQFCPLERDDDVLRGAVLGPKGSTVPLTLKGNRLQVGPHQLELSRDASTPWLPLKFGAARGLAQFLKLDADSLYMSPLQIDPARPSTPVSWPPLFSLTLSHLQGPFATCGLAEDTGAREDGVLTDPTFLQQAYALHEERRQQFFHLLERTRKGCLVAVFDGPDRIQHMFSGNDQEPVLEDMYERMDRLVGEARARIKDDEVLLVLSDHGFKPLHTLVDVNAWLQQNHHLQAIANEVDFAQSRAFVYNLSGVRLNLQGRESQGIVFKEQATQLLQDLRKALLQLQHEGRPVFGDVFLSTTAYQGPYIERAPDLVLGFAPGFGIFKDATRGKVSPQIFHPNASSWSGDHGFHPDAVPGVLFCNRPLCSGARIIDLAATVLDLHGLPKPPWMDGSSLLPEAPAAPVGSRLQPVEL